MKRGGTGGGEVGVGVESTTKGERKGVGWGEGVRWRGKWEGGRQKSDTVKEKGGGAGRGGRQMSDKVNEKG